MSENKNPDYTETAENLRNPEEVRILLGQMHAEQIAKKEKEAELYVQSKGLVDDITSIDNSILSLQKRIKEAVEEYGSYQDMETGDYAVKYRRMSKSYHPEPLKEYFPKFAELCIQEAVNVAALEGQIKGKLLTIEELKRVGVITEKPTFVFYIR